MTSCELLDNFLGILAGPVIVIVSWAIGNNLVYFDCIVIVSWVIENNHLKGVVVY